MKASELMTSDPFTVTPGESLKHAAELMRNVDVGSMPVVQDTQSRKLVGIITDRDIAIRCVAEGHPGTCTVKDHMTVSPLDTVHEGDDESKVVEVMERSQVRRIPVVDANERLVGIIAQADVARKLGPAEPNVVDEVLEKISTPMPVDV